MNNFSKIDHITYTRGLIIPEAKKPRWLIQFNKYIILGDVHFKLHRFDLEGKYLDSIADERLSVVTGLCKVGNKNLCVVNGGGYNKKTKKSVLIFDENLVEIVRDKKLSPRFQYFGIDHLNYKTYIVAQHTKTNAYVGIIFSKNLSRKKLKALVSPIKEQQIRLRSLKIHNKKIFIVNSGTQYSIQVFDLDFVYQKIIPCNEYQPWDISIDTNGNLMVLMWKDPNAQEAHETLLALFDNNFEQKKIFSLEKNINSLNFLIHNDLMIISHLDEKFQPFNELYIFKVGYH